MTREELIEFVKILLDMGSEMAPANRARYDELLLKWWAQQQEQA